MIKVDKSTYGLQFHIEVDGDIMESWIKKYFKCEDPKQSQEGKKMLELYERYKKPFFDSIGKYKILNAARKLLPMQHRRYERSEFSCQAEIIYQNFAQIIRKTKLTQAKV